ncbi:hypothetical protein KBY78_00335 [Synechococcus sp. EJ6-Ellesmere]|nr:hypothetical protein [Synechococcus sp. EJ6-Ellesmere]
MKNSGRSIAVQAVTRNEIDENRGNGRETLLRIWFTSFSQLFTAFSSILIAENDCTAVL